MNLFIIMLMSGIPSIIFAQEVTAPTFSKYSLTIDLGHQKIGFPFRKPFGNPYHFYADLGASREWKSKRKHATYQTIDLAIFHNNSSGSGYFILSNYGYRYHFTPSIYLAGEAGAGFFHIFRPEAVYQLQSNGAYEQIRDWGKIHPAADFNFQLGYQPGKIGICLGYRIVTEFFYNQDAVFFPQTFLSIGLHYKI